MGCPTPVSCTKCIFNRGFHRSLARLAVKRVSGFAPLTASSLGADIFKCAVCVAMQGNFSLQHTEMALVSRPTHKITMGQHFKTDVTEAVSIKEGWLSRPMFFFSVYLNMWIVLCLIQIFFCFTIVLYISLCATIQFFLTVSSTCVSQLEPLTCGIQQLLNRFSFPCGIT